MLTPQLGVQVRERLVEQQHLRVHHQRAGQRHPLLLAAAQLVRRALLQPGQAEKAAASRRHAAARSASRATPASLRPYADVLGDAHVREQRVVLEDHRRAAPVGGTSLMRRLAEHDVADVRLVEAGDHPQRRGLAAAGGPSSVVKLPRGTSSETSSTAGGLLPKRLVTPDQRMCGVSHRPPRPDARAAGR